MSYPSGNQGYYSAGFDDGTEPDEKPALPRYLAIAVLVLGIASYLASFGPMPDGNVGAWGVRFAVLAGLLAGFGLIHRQSSGHAVVAALAVAGFLDALAAVITTSGVGGALILIVVLNGIQSAAAIIALLQANPTDDAEALSAYQAYADYWAQLQYYGQYPEATEAPEAVQRAGQGQAAGQTGGLAAGQAVPQMNARPARPAEAQAAGYGDFVGNQDPERTAIIDRIPAQPEQHPGQAGLPNAARAQAQAPSQQQGVPPATAAIRPPGAP